MGSARDQHRLARDTRRHLRYAVGPYQIERERAGRIALAERAADWPIARRGEHRAGHHQRLVRVRDHDCVGEQAIERAVIEDQIFVDPQKRIVIAFRRDRGLPRAVQRFGPIGPGREEQIVFVKAALAAKRSEAGYRPIGEAGDEDRHARSVIHRLQT